MIDTFGRHRLLAFDRDPLTRSPTVEISHEALLREWKRFGRWIDDARDDLRARRRLDVAADEWHDRDQDPDFVFTGAQFAHFQGWLENPPVHLTAREADFLRASAVRQAELDTREAEEALRESQLKTRSRLLIGMSLVALLFIGLAAYAFTLRRTAQQAQADIRAFQQSLVLASESLAVLADDPDLALMLALEAGRDTAGAGFIAPEVLDTLHWALQQKGVQYPADDTTAIAVRNGPLGLGRPPGPRGVFMVAPAELLELAQDAVTRPFTEDECSRYFAGEACPDLGGSIPGGVTVLGGDEAYGSVPQSLDALAATTVFVRDSFSEADSRPFRESLEAVSRATDIELRNFLYRDPFLAAEGRDGPADILVLEWTNPARDLIDRGLVIDLTAYLDPVGLRDAFGSHAISLMTVGADGSYPAAAGAVHGFPIRTDLKSLFWYAAEEFDAAGYLIPRTWEGTMSLADLIAADGAEPFCLGFEDGPFTGWLPADWVESIVLRSQGPDFYDRWFCFRGRILAE